MRCRENVIKEISHSNSFVRHTGNFKGIIITSLAAPTVYITVVTDFRLRRNWGD